MDSTNYALFRTKFQIKSGNSCLNNKTLLPESCSGVNIGLSPVISKFEKVTFGDNTYAIVDDKFQTCISKNEKEMVNFNNFSCKIFNQKELLPMKQLYNKSFFTGIITDSMLNFSSNPEFSTYTPDPNFDPKSESNSKYVYTLPTIPPGYTLPNGTSLNMYDKLKK
jgi:hypothetical protein